VWVQVSAHKIYGRMARTVLPYLLALHTAPRAYLLLSLPAGALPATSSVGPAAAALEHDPMLPAQLLQYLRSAGIAEQLQVFAPAACGAASPLISELSVAHMLQSVRFLTCLAQRSASATADEGEASVATDFRQTVYSRERAPPSSTRRTIPRRRSSSTGAVSHSRPLPRLRTIRRSRRSRSHSTAWCKGLRRA
jgi:hypothetical protein